MVVYKTKPKVILLHYTPLEIMDKAIGTCWDKHKEEVDIERIDRVVNKFKHASTSEHCSFNFYISNVSRALLQELARHRISSFSVKSTRYTLKELKDEESFYFLHNNEQKDYNEDDEFYNIKEVIRASKYLVYTGDILVDYFSIKALENLRILVLDGKANDVAKYCIPESYKTELTWTINVRSLKNFLKLRSDKSALWEIRNLAYEIFNSLPEEYKFLFENDMYKEK